MINIALSLIRNELQAWLTASGDATTEVVLENVALLETANSDVLLNKVVLSLVNIEEESALKNGRATRRTLSGGIEYAAPPVSLNLYLLFCANYPGGNQPGLFYAQSLERLSNIIRFIHGKPVFTFKNSPASAGLMNDPDLVDPDRFRLTLELYTLTFEQINHLWGSLGGRQLPFVMYKARLVQIEDREAVRPGAIIEEIELNLVKMGDG